MCCLFIVYCSNAVLQRWGLCRRKMNRKMNATNFFLITAPDYGKSNQILGTGCLTDYSTTREPTMKNHSYAMVFFRVLLVPLFSEFFCSNSENSDAFEIARPILNFKSRANK